MKAEMFIHDDFYLNDRLARDLYHQVAKQLPVIDFHNHLDPKVMAENRRFRNLADAWVLTDPYKHRAMRICGVPENGITGIDSDKEKFLNWAAVVPKTSGNPLFVWSALELKRIFGIDEFLSEKNSLEIWDTCNAILQQEGFSATDILKKFRVEKLCTSDDLLDDTGLHDLATRTQGIEVFPSIRGDSMLGFDQPYFHGWFKKLQEQTHQAIRTLEEYKAVILQKLDEFAAAGCRLADHSLDSGFDFDPPSEKQASLVYEDWLIGIQTDASDLACLKNHILLFLGQEYARRGWILQLHIGAHRFTSSRLRQLAGPSGGFAAIGNPCNIAGLCSFFDEMEKRDSLPKIILYSLNPADNKPFSTLTGSYSADGVPGIIRFGPAWWYNDQYEGIKSQLTDLAGYGLISQFIGMTTDSRSVFSFSRHEYFRRILCSIISGWVKEGNLPGDFLLLSGLVSDICYHNSKNFIFGPKMFSE